MMLHSHKLAVDLDFATIFSNKMRGRYSTATTKMTACMASTLSNPTKYMTTQAANLYDSAENLLTQILNEFPAA